MSTAFLQNRKVIAVTVGVLLLGGGAWGVASLARSKKTALPKDLAQVIKTSDDPHRIFQAVHEAENRKDLTDAQRHELHETVRNAMEAQMDKRIDEYFTASDSQKQVILDRQIDEMQARMKEWQQHRAERERLGQQRQPGQPGTPRPDSGGARSGGGNAAVAGGPGGAPGAGPGPGGPGGPGARGDRHGPPSREQRMQFTQSRNPDKAARRMAYFAAMHQRAQQRGIQTPRFGGPGGPGR